MPYTAEFESELIRGVGDPYFWDVVDEIVAWTDGQDALLDIGCGTAFKILPLTPVFEIVVGLEPNPAMIKKAVENAKARSVTNLQIIAGRCENLPFEDDTFDIVSGMLAPHDTAEVHRVLKVGGIAVIEKLGEQDKLNFKSMFASDEKGSRAQLGEFAPGGRKKLYEAEFGDLFSEFEITDGFWSTYYTKEGVQLLLEQTPTVRGFNIETDQLAFESLVDKFQTHRGIGTTQHRLLIVAQK